LDQTGVWFPKRAQFGIPSNNVPPPTHRNIAEYLSGWFPLYVDTYKGAITPGIEAHVLQIAKMFAGFAPAMKVYVTPYGDMASTSRTVVMRVLKTAGLTNVVSRTSRKIWTRSSSASRSSGRLSYVKISVKESPTPDLAHSNLYRYPSTAVHEFGHMIGLKDEYRCLSQQAKNAMVQCNFINPSEADAVQTRAYAGATDTTPEAQPEMAEFVRYCHQAGVTVPLFGQHTTSIMSSGNVFLPCHFVTLWAALVHVSGHADWEIVPHT
jgi:hypothetical protein